MKKQKQAFTLIELIVVITILVILGTISFISIQNYSVEARDTKRISDIRSLLTKITTEHTKGMPLENIMNIESKKTNNLIINGHKKGGEQGVINFQILNEPSNLFKDPSNNQDYPFAYAIGTTNDDEKYEFIGLATIMETEQKTMIMGNYFKYKEGDSPSLFTNEDGKEIENESDDLIYNPGLQLKYCSPKITEDNYKLENKLFNETQITLSKPGNENNGIIEHGNIIKEQDYQCNRGILEKIGEERIITNCINEENQEYIPNQETKTCLKVINGVCGNGGDTIAITTAPNTNLCTAGINTTVNNSTNTWTWSCTGTNGGTTASCSRPRAYCNTIVPTGAGIATTIIGTPTSTNQAWVQGASNCGYTCKSYYFGANCATYTPPEERYDVYWSGGGLYPTSAIVYGRGMTLYTWDSVTILNTAGTISSYDSGGYRYSQGSYKGTQDGRQWYSIIRTKL